MTFLLCHTGVLRDPLLYLSLYVKQHRQEYYALLDGVRRDGDWEAWLSFPAASSAMDLLLEIGISRELTDRRRNRLFVYDRYLSILNEGTEAT